MESCSVCVRVALQLVELGGQRLAALDLGVDDPLGDLLLGQLQLGSRHELLQKDQQQAGQHGKQPEGAAASWPSMALVSSSRGRRMDSGRILMSTPCARRLPDSLGIRPDLQGTSTSCISEPARTAPGPCPGDAFTRASIRRPLGRRRSRRTPRPRRRARSAAGFHWRRRSSRARGRESDGRQRRQCRHGVGLPGHAPVGASQQRAVVAGDPARCSRPRRRCSAASAWWSPAAASSSSRHCWSSRSCHRRRPPSRASRSESRCHRARRFSSPSAGSSAAAAIGGAGDGAVLARHPAGRAVDKINGVEIVREWRSSSVA